MHPDTIIVMLLTSAVTIADIQVTQSPRNIEVTEGMQFHLYCVFTASAMPAVAAYTWYKQGPGHEKSYVKNTSGEFYARVLEQDVKSFEANKNASITIMGAKRNDSGLYYCEVDLFDGRDTGKGTLVRVKGGNGSNKEHSSSISKSNWIILSSVLGLIVLVLIHIAVLAACHFCKQRDRTPRNGMEEQGAASNTVVYSDVHFKNNKKHRPGNLNKDQRACPVQNEDTIVYATLGPLNEKRNKKKRRPPNEAEEPAVYGKIRIPEYNGASGM
uniref:uncharacterized protein isoform X1 n=2 Tax=Pristiophorus japonicus TaxID=55135 RepID=UPI00398E708F